MSHLMQPPHPYHVGQQVVGPSQQLETCYLTLLSLAEGFRTCSPPDYESATQCLMAVLNLPQVDTLGALYLARTNLQIAKMLIDHSSNPDAGKSYLEKAFQTAQLGHPEQDEIKFEAAYRLARLFERQGNNTNAMTLIRRCIDNSSNNMFWHCKLLFHAATFYARIREYSNASLVLQTGADYANNHGAQFTRILFLLSKGMMLMIHRDLNEVGNVLRVAGQLVESWQGNTQKKETLKVFFLILQVCHHLNNGQVKTGKNTLKFLQQSIQTLQADTTDAGLSGEGFHWMPKDQLCILVYLVTVLHSMQSGAMDKVQKYTEKALTQIENLKNQDDNPILTTFQLLLLEHIAMCRLVMGQRAQGIKETVQAIQICYRGDSALQLRHKSVLHTLLGLYAMSMNQMNEAENQLSLVLRDSSISAELRILASLNLAIVYLRMNRDRELNDLLSKMNPDHFPCQSQALKAAAFYVLGLNAFFQARHSDAKKYLRETLKMANGEDLNRLTSCSLVLLGHIFLSLGCNPESSNMVTPALQLASKIPDIQIQLWATALLKDLYRICGDSAKEQEYQQAHHQFSQQLYQDQNMAFQLHEHSYINWLGENTA